MANRQGAIAEDPRNKGAVNARSVAELDSVRGRIDSLAYSPLHNLLALTGGNPEMAVVKATSFEPIITKQKWDIVRDMAFSPDGKLLATGYGVVKVLDAATLEQKYELTSPHLMEILMMSMKQ